MFKNTAVCALCLDHPGKCIDRTVKVILIQHTVFCCCSIEPGGARGLNQDATSSSNGDLSVGSVVLGS
jgi:hypothetical protein